MVYGRKLGGRIVVVLRGDYWNSSPDYQAADDQIPF
jgi:hypothetical protein